MEDWVGFIVCRFYLCHLPTIKQNNTTLQKDKIKKNCIFYNNETESLVVSMQA